MKKSNIIKSCVSATKLIGVGLRRLELGSIENPRKPDEWHLVHNLPKLINIAFCLLNISKSTQTIVKLTKVALRAKNENSLCNSGSERKIIMILNP